MRHEHRNKMKKQREALHKKLKCQHCFGQEKYPSSKVKPYFMFLGIGLLTVALLCPCWMLFLTAITMKELCPTSYHMFKFNFGFWERIRRELIFGLRSAEAFVLTVETTKIQVGKWCLNCLKNQFYYEQDFQIEPLFYPVYTQDTSWRPPVEPNQRTHLPGLMELQKCPNMKVLHFHSITFLLRYKFVGKLVWSRNSPSHVSIPQIKMALWSIRINKEGKYVR